MTKERLKELFEFSPKDVKLLFEWFDKLKEVIEFEDLPKWMTTRNFKFDDKMPCEMILSGDTKPLERMIKELTSV